MLVVVAAAGEGTGEEGSAPSLAVFALAKAVKTVWLLVTKPTSSCAFLETVSVERVVVCW